MHKIGDFSVLRVVAIESIGAFLDWGQEKDLFLPHSEQTAKFEIGDDVIVRIYEDNLMRPCSSMRLERFLDKHTQVLKPEQKVDLLIFGQTDLGYKAVINSQFLGILYKNEVFHNIEYADKIVGYIKKVRDDGKVDLILQPFGNKGSADLGERIVEVLKQNNGFLDLTEKTTPEKIYEIFGVSKKKYKMALGGVYKKKLITIDPDGIRLIIAK
jgi:predicted RNA-binding protein (virulence factor B family)